MQVCYTVAVNQVGKLGIIWDLQIKKITHVVLIVFVKVKRAVVAL